MNGTIESNVSYGAARVLLGWMETDDALRVQHGMRADIEMSTAAAERLRAARERVAARPGGIDQRDCIAPPPRELASYLDELQRHRLMEPKFAQGWTPSLIDLRKLCAVQSRVFTDRMDEQFAGVDPGDLHSIAAVSLPLPSAPSLPAFFDSKRSAWVMSSPDPNLKVVGNFGRQQDDGTTGLGFSVALGRSYVAAIHHGGRYYLTDGYHRSVAFLRRGITHVPGLIRHLRDDEPFNTPSGMLPASAYLSERPPQLADFLEDGVAMSVILPVFRKIILIQAIEVMA